MDRKQFKEYDLIASGKILHVDFGEFTQTIEVGINTIFKGKVRRMTIVLSSSGQSGMCGIFPKEGEKWLIYAHGKGMEFSTNLCTRTQNMSRANNREKEMIERDLSYLRKNSTRKKAYRERWL
ncbi:MAG: hypothetical protein AAF466_04990 [Bacteroidota bacterium]